VRVENYQVLIALDPESRLWVTQVPAIDLSTYGETRDQAIEATREAILGYLEAAEKEGLPLPDTSSRAELVEIEIARA
jgi:predicted RNase H-like HicB family nuclease